MTAPRVALLVLCLTSLTARAQFQPPSSPSVPPPAGQTASPDGVRPPSRQCRLVCAMASCKISADNGTPNPPAWYIVAKTGNGEVFSVTVAQGQLVEEKPSLNLRRSLRLRRRSISRDSQLAQTAHGRRRKIIRSRRARRWKRQLCAGAEGTRMRRRSGRSGPTPRTVSYIGYFNCWPIPERDQR